MSMTIDDLVDQLWDKTGADWHAEFSVVMTEPTCAVVSIYSDDDHLPSVRGYICKSRHPYEAIVEGIVAVLAQLPSN